MAIPLFSLRTSVTPAHHLTRIQSVIQQALDEHRLVGAVVLVARNGELIYQQAVGWADRERERPMKLDTIFRLASVSKPIVSATALVLVAQGRLSLDDNITHWLPDFQPRQADGTEVQITVRQLLSHTAGLGYRFFETDVHGPYAQAEVSDGMDASGMTLDENICRLASVPLLYTPGTAWGYSLATDVLGALIARVHGTPLDKAVRQLVTSPLGMVDTGFSVSDPQRVATAYVNDRSQPHSLAEGETVSPFEGAVGITYSPSRIFDAKAFPSGGAGMAGTAIDFINLLETLRQGGGALLPCELVEEMGRDQTGGLELPNAPGFGFGLGFSVLRDPQLAASPESPGTWRWGGAYGHAWFLDRARGLNVVAFTNTMYEGMSGRFVADLRDAVYDELEGS